MKHRYPGIHSFTAEEQALFFGREREKKELFRLVVLNEIVVLFGKSGTGKTSLLQAGVGPLLTERHLQPVKVRLNNTQQPISRQIFEQLNDGDYLPLNTPDDLSLWEYCKCFEYAPGGEAFAPVLLLDQFEELFTLYHDQPEAQQDLISQLAALLNHKIPAHVQEAAKAIAGEAERARWLAPPQVNIVISIRSDFLYLLDRLSARIPSILRCRYELMALDEANTRLAITRPPALGGPFASPVFSYSEAALQEMVDSLVTIDADKDTIAPGAVREVEPFQAQLLCQHIEQKIIAEQRPDGFVVTPDFYGGKLGINNIRKQYFNSVLARFDALTRPKVERLLSTFLLINNRRIIQERNYLLEKCSLTEFDIDLLCAERILCEEPRRNSYYLEISHDTIAVSISDALKERREMEAKEAEQNLMLEVVEQERNKERKNKTILLWILGVLLTLFFSFVVYLMPKFNQEEIIATILALLPFSIWMEQAGLSKELSAALATVFALALLYGAYSLAQKALQRWKLQKTARVLDPQFDYAAMRQATRYYIPTQFQNASPAREDEPGFTHQHVIRSPLIPFFLKNAFHHQRESERFYLILADSGMGKTTFMINLYLAYHGFFNRHRQHQMRLFRFSNPDTMTQVSAIRYDEAIDTILLLDALDEDPFIVSQGPAMTDAQAFQKRLDDIVEATRNFAEVVMTCRTQYFPGQEDDPYELKVKRPDERGFFTLKKLYLSPFTMDELQLYLRKKYGYLPFVHRNKKQKALQVIRQAKHLVMRPMMLSYIDLLLGNTRQLDSHYAIYETLIEEWLKREADKRKYRDADRKVFVQNLRDLSEQTALSLWKIRQTENRAYLTKAEAVAISERNNIPLRPEEVTGQSLLTCDGAGNWKFAHKSVWEFFLAKEIIAKGPAFVQFNHTGMDMTRQFCQVFVPDFIHIQGGKFLMGSPGKEDGREENETQHLVQVSSFFMAATPVTLAQFEYFVQESGYQTEAEKDGGSFIWDGKKDIKKPGVNWRHDSSGKLQVDKAHPVLHVSWNDATAYAAWLGQQWNMPCRLPTEAEWEYAARGGSQSQGYKYSGSNDLNEVGWYGKNAGGKTHPVGQLRPNVLGLYDMNGNVWEWCRDWYDDKYYQEYHAKGTAKDPLGPATGSNRVLRGGSWHNTSQHCRAAYRDSGTPTARHYAVGFRLACSSF